MVKFLRMRYILIFQPDNLRKSWNKLLICIEVPSDLNVFQIMRANVSVFIPQVIL